MDATAIKVLEEDIAALEERRSQLLEAKAQREEAENRKKEEEKGEREKERKNSTWTQGKVEETAPRLQTAIGQVRDPTEWDEAEFNKLEEKLKEKKEMLNELKKA